MKRVLSEREQLRALMLVAAACGANRLGAIVEGRAWQAELGGLFGVNAFWNHDLPLVGAFVAAALIHRRDARLTTLVSAVTCAIASVLSAVGIGTVGGLLTSVGTGAFTVGSFAFAAELVVPEEDEQRASPSRFAGMAAFVFTRVAMMSLGTMAWSLVPYDIARESLVEHGVGIALALASVAAVAFALPRVEAEAGAGPTQPVYRAPSPMEVEPAVPEPRVPAKIWPAVRPFVAPAALFAFATSAMAHRMGSRASYLFGGFASAAAAIYFVRVWRRRSAVSVVGWYARGLMVAAAGWMVAGLGSFFGFMTYAGVVAAAVGGAVSGLSLGFVALAARGRRAGLALACWLVLTSVATSASELFFYGGGLLILLVGIVSFVIARGLGGRARDLEARL